MNIKSFTKNHKVASTVGSAIGLWFIWSTFTIIQPQQVGIVTRLGAIKYVAKSGFHWKLPIDSVAKFNTAIQQIEIIRDPINSSDNQRVFVDLNVQYYIPADGVLLVFTKYPNYSDRIQTLTADIFRQEMGKHDAANIPTERGQIQEDTLIRTQKEAKRLYGIDVTEIQILNFDYNDVYKKSIDDMTQAKSLRRQSEIIVDTKENEAKTAKIEATGQADAEKARADGKFYSIKRLADANAYKIKEEGNANAEAMKLQNEAIKSSPQYVQYTLARQWDGKLPQNIGVGATSSIPFINGTIK